MRTWAIWLYGVAALLALVFLFCTHRPTTSSDWAGWAQAFGSILAIIAAFAVPSIQFSHELRRKREADAELLRSLLVLVEQLIAHIDAYSADLKNLNNPDRVVEAARFHLHKAYSCLVAIGRLPLERFTMSATVTLALVEIGAQGGDHSHAVYNGIVEPNNPTLEEERVKYRDLMAGHAKTIRAAIERIASGRTPTI